VAEEEKRTEETERYHEDESNSITKGFEQMEMIYKSRCIQVPDDSNVTVREIVKEE